MSKFEPIPLDTLPCCACCKHLDRSVVYTSNPPKYMCKLFHDYVTGDQRTCLEDEPKRTVPPQGQGEWTANDLVNRLRDFTQKAVYEGVRGGGSFLPPQGYINGKERRIMERLEALEKKVDWLLKMRKEDGKARWDSWGEALTRERDLIDTDTRIINKMAELVKAANEKHSALDRRIATLETLAQIKREGHNDTRPNPEA